VARVKPLQRSRHNRRTMHDGDYHRVLKAIQRARAIMKSTGRNHLDVRCPICGVFNAVLVVREGQNTGNIVAAMCTRGCFTAWE
jgi:phage FluMu protein Com